ncbi:Peptidoglycan deacetylase [Stieleria neptunia]|uniref:Peptidoglycan deacetylase n=1 Tax=Stieleria neptunia TaxID=2527979 RepID=A0A518HN62_9BACT|nr:polysaccharide deacetylase family protein [Stieleria neptunia]QDV42296.1 Peptidoglycan deacetylase [Stieleria neptunia]
MTRSAVTRIESPSSPKHALTIDVECYYQIFQRNYFATDVQATREVVTCTEKLLDLLASTGVCGTFFIVGRVAETFPSLVRRIVNENHELGSHGFSHIYVNKVTESEFRDDLRRSRETLEDIGGTAVCGFRAPQFSLDRSTPWAYDVLCDLGFQYDSSVFPFSGRHYGDPQAPLVPWTVQRGNKSILEIPMTVVKRLGRRWPAAGGGYLRYLPYDWNASAIRQVEREHRHAVVYLHPYELADNTSNPDFDVAVRAAPWKTRFAHRMQLINRGKTVNKLSKLIRQFDFGTIRDVFQLQHRSNSGPVERLRTPQRNMLER